MTVSSSKYMLLFSFVIVSSYEHVGHIFTSTDGVMLKFPTRNAFFCFHLWLRLLKDTIYFYWWRDVIICKWKCMLFNSFMTVFLYGHAFTNTDCGMLKIPSRNSFVLICNCFPLLTCIYFHSWRDVTTSSSNSPFWVHL